MRIPPARRLALGLVAALTLTVGACGDQTDTSDSRTGEVSVSDAWVRATTGTDDPTMTGAFMMIENGTDADVTLVGASSPVTEMVQLHEMVPGEDGHMVMQEAPDGILVRAGKTQMLMPGGYHVMLMGLTDDLPPGAEVALSLQFSDGGTVEVTAPVKEFTEEVGHYHSPTAGMSDSMSPSS